MRFSRGFLPTLKEAPAEAEVVSHKLMVRSGMIRRLAAGVYTLLPLGVRVQRKVEQILREELNRAGAQEVFLPTLNPAELWRKTGRWEVYGKELIRLKDRHEREFCLGPTHEEVITDLVAREVRSYRDLPLNLYQIQTKFRDEIRPRFGVMRGREFTMKDGYSFDRDEAGAEQSYEEMVQAYTRIFRRCGLKFSAVEADSGAIGGSFSHEFMVMADTGEEAITVCDSCGYAANVEKSPVRLKLPENEGGELEKVHTPGAHSIEEVSEFFSLPSYRMAKTLLYVADGEPVAAMIPGHRELNEIKLKNALDAVDIELADAETVEELTNSEVGFAGPVGLSDVRLVVDYAIENGGGLIVGANQTDYHYTGAREGRDFEASKFADLTVAQEGDGCPKCDAGLSIRRGIEVGHVFKLGCKYSESLDATYQDEGGETHTIVMGCYGIGVGRTVAAAIEQNHDEDGIIWPTPIAPYHVDIIPVRVNDETMKICGDIYDSLESAGLDVALDDRDERPGVKFKDADLIGFPYKVVVGPRGLKERKIELKSRRTGDTQLVAINEAASFLNNLVFGEIDPAG
ncbi:MAG: proline--tRNA ligase [Nitrospinae bacterium]|nr:proline--tRNA ligase [Nitrospinota bacterium]